MGAPQSTEPQDGLTSEELVRQELIEPAEDIEPVQSLEPSGSGTSSSEE